MYPIILATKQNIPAIVHLLNLTYRGDESLKGWTSEASIIKGPIRTDIETIENLIEEPNSYFLICLDEKKDVIGCVNLKKNGQRMYLGMLSVLPDLQGKGIGKLFLTEAEILARKKGCHAIYMQVISHRTELNDWYKRRGYVFTGEKKPFDVDKKYGVPTMPLEFVYLEKNIKRKGKRS